MQASGGQQQEDGQGHVGSPQDGRSGSIGVGGESMSRNGSASAIAAVTAASPTSSQSHSDGGAATPAGHRLKIRIGGSTLGGSNHRTGSVSSEGTNGHSTPRATTPVAVPAAVSTPKSNGHLEHHDGAKTMHNGDISRETIKQELDNEGRAVSVSSEKLSQAASQQERLDPKPPSKTEEKQDELPVQEAQEDEETKRKKEEQLRSALAELPNVARQSLVPLYELVRRLVARSYTDLQNIVEVLPSQSDFDRKRTIIEYVITTRRQIIKLLVLLRWAKENTEDTERSINLIAFLQRQNYQLERAVQALQGVEGLLTGARVRNYDLITAVEVLTTGTYAQLPTLFQDSFIPPPKLTNQAVVALLQDLESVIRLRLQLYEHIPIQLLRQPYRIHDGRVTFHCPGYFKAAYTLGGDSPTDQWYLVDFSFDFNGRDVQQHPTGAMREHILQVYNTKLAECATKEKEQREKHAETGTAYEQKGSAFISTVPLLQGLCLNYQMELIHYHAIQTNNIPTVWQGMLGISISSDRRTLEIRNQALSKAPLPPPQYGPDLRYEELLTITIGQAETPKAVRPVSTRLSQLAERFAVISSTEAAAAAVSSMKDHAGQPSPQDKFIMSCRFSREPMFLDSKGKRVPQPVQRKVVMRKVEFPVDILDHTDGKVTIRDIELVLGQCFSLKASMIPQA